MILKFIAFILRFKSMCYHRGDGFSLVSYGVPINIKTCLDLLDSEAFHAIRALTDRPIGIKFQEKPEDGLSIKVFRKRRRYFIIVSENRPEIGLARGLDTLWRYLANVGPEY
tara:strand:+ start:370 stop:705 length:336 start_codon:yes stop_codon:yes gene_type:complete